MKGRAWTIKEIENLKLLMDYGIKQSEIGARLNRSVDSIKTKVKLLKREGVYEKARCY